jgi:RimJ/RimL family protein N-acetyltransferase
MYVRPTHRGKGLASDLVNTVLTSAQDIGCELIQLAVGTRNEASYSLYLRMGFTVYGTEARAMKIDDEYVDEYLMVKFFR